MKLTKIVVRRSERMVTILFYFGNASCITVSRFKDTTVSRWIDPAAVSWSALAQVSALDTLIFGQTLLIANIIADLLSVSQHPAKFDLSTSDDLKSFFATVQVELEQVDL
jgi:hypothetical protein